MWAERILFNWLSTTASFNSQASTVTVTMGNTPPVANAGPNQKVNVEAVVQLNGAGSTDVNGNPLTYSWTLSLSQAPGSKATLSNPDQRKPHLHRGRAGHLCGAVDSK